MGREPEGSQRRLEQLARERASGELEDAVPAATVVLLRDGAGGLETLLLRRDARLGFGGGAWVFPGGRVDPADRRGVEPGGEPADELAAARRAAAREAQEEADLLLDPADLVPFAHWTPPVRAGRRFATWFFAGKASGAAVTVDGGEIVDHVWARPGEALARHASGEIDLLVPTWITLHLLVDHAGVDRALEALAAREPERFVTRLAPVEGGVVALYHDDAGYEVEDASIEGRRHRLWMLGREWRYERD